ncbi:ABC transporter substrate-binding protein [uncultured Psychrobacillus sp.]|uniref:ABC transporter substrate-binding protein n=1 Tax=uncultured Psychrobacillus sp. TaxID=1551585 RepID=UPI00262906FC|nr:ABC transporter substrate-binding protein [uncultured Psychrobacillus sp.]
MKQYFKKCCLPTLTILLMFVLVACSSSEKGENDSSGQESEQDNKKSVQSQQLENLTIGLTNDVGPLNIYTGNLDWLTDLVYDKLFSPSPYVEKPTPWLAESATQIDDTTWDVVVRDGIKWHDGEDFTAEDVKFTYEYYRDGPANRHTHHVSEVPKIDTIEVQEDGKTVRFECGYPCPSLLTITFADLPILPEHIWSKVENPRKHTELAVGTGPFILTEYVTNQHYKLKANNDYFMGQPTVANLTLPIISDATAMFNSLKSGEVDVSSRPVPAELISTFINDNNFKLAEASALSIVQFNLNYGIEPYDNPEFREAMSLAIDRQAIVDTILLGQGQAGTKGYPHPASPWTNPDLSTPYDLKQAKEKFAALGYKDTNGDGLLETADGEVLTTTIKVSSGEPIFVRTAELMAEHFTTNVGIQMNVQALDATTFAAHSSEKNYQATISLIGPHGVADPDQFIMSHRSGYLWTKEVAYPEMDALISDWMAATDIESRKLISFDMQKQYNSQPTSIALYYPKEVYAYNAEVFDQYVESLGYGIINKYSFLSKDVQTAVSATEPVSIK